jgi:RNA polymerase sigma-70 factor (ECF subfamily)
MQNDSATLEKLITQAAHGNTPARVELFAQFRERLRETIRLRMDRRLQARLDADDVLQEVYLDYERRLPEFVAHAPGTFFLWLRGLALQRLIDLHRVHVGAQRRSAGREVSLFAGGLPEASSASLAALLVGRLTSASKAVQRAELQLKVQEALNTLDDIDREVLVLRHFELLTNEETAQTLGLSKSAASNRYVRALKLLKEILDAIPDLRPEG